MNQLFNWSDPRIGYPWCGCRFGQFDVPSAGQRHNDLPAGLVGVVHRTGTGREWWWSVGTGRIVPVDHTGCHIHVVVRNDRRTGRDRIGCRIAVGIAHHLRPGQWFRIAVAVAVDRSLVHSRIADPVGLVGLVGLVDCIVLPRAIVGHRRTIDRTWMIDHRDNHIGCCIPDHSPVVDHRISSGRSCEQCAHRSGCNGLVDLVDLVDPIVLVDLVDPIDPVGHREWTCHRMGIAGSLSMGSAVDDGEIRTSIGDNSKGWGSTKSNHIDGEVHHSQIRDRPSSATVVEGRRASVVGWW